MEKGLKILKGALKDVYPHPFSVKSVSRFGPQTMKNRTHSDHNITMLHPFSEDKSRRNFDR